MHEQLPYFVTFSKNYARRFKDTDLFEKIFAKILNEVNKYGFIDDENIFIESFIETFILSNKWVKCECV